MNNNNKFFNFIYLVFCIYFFIFSLNLIKDSSFEIGQEIFSLTKNNLNPINAFGLGWLATLITQSSGAAAATLITFHLSGIIGPFVLIYMIIGTRIGTSITSLFSAFLINAKKRDFRHGFEIGLTNLVYAIPIALIMILLEYFTGFFHKTGNYFTSFGISSNYRIIDIIVKPIINLLSPLSNNFKVVLGIILLIISLKYIPKIMINLWGEVTLRSKINKILDKKWKSFLLGFGVTSILMSTSITITFLIPLVVTKITKLKKVIPYMIGANLGGVSEVIIGGLFLGKGAFPAVFTYTSFSVIGLLWMFNTNLLFNITKFISKKTLNISRKKALFFIISFVLVAVILSFI